ncbi:Small-conductance mechanosensitive channel MscMJ [uncultured archaeon]|nr:Small-conductance mechanosensitive channel MscMJ [uncultured archaeon]
MEDPARLLIVLSAIYAALSITYPDTKLGSAGISQLYVVLLMLNGAFALEQFLSTVLEWYRREVAPKTASKLDDEMIPVLEKIAKFVIYVFALVMMLGNLGIEITPLLAGLGIASLAVAIAIQDSLGNFFAGVNIAVDRPLRKDDYISTDAGVEGVVQEIGWRSTKILTTQNNIVVIPNTKLSQSTITNYYRPDEMVLYPGTVGVSYGADVDHVTRAIRSAILNAAGKCSLIDPAIEPAVRLDSFGDFALNFRYLFGLKDYRRRLDAADAVNRAIFQEFQKEGIEIPFPTRTLYTFQKAGQQKEGEKQEEKKKGKEKK